MKFRSKINHGFTKCICLHYNILKAYKARDAIFLQNNQKQIFKILKIFKYSMKFTRAACWINSKICNTDKNSTLMIFLFCHYRWSLLWCNYWRSLMLWNSTSWGCLKLTVQIQLVLYPCDPSLINNCNYFVMLNVKLEVKLGLKTFYWL